MMVMLAALHTETRWRKALAEGGEGKNSEMVRRKEPFSFLLSSPASFFLLSGSSSDCCALSVVYFSKKRLTSPGVLKGSDDACCPSVDFCFFFWTLEKCLLDQYSGWDC